MEAVLTELLLRHNCVIVPELGGFVAKRLPAQFDEATGKIYPPSKKLTFNARLVNNDGLLISALAANKKLAFDEAAEEVRIAITAIHETLRKGQRYFIENIGQLYLNEEGNINFEQDRFFNLLLASYGLGMVEFVPVAAQQTDEEKEAVQQPREATLKLDNKAPQEKATEIAEPAQLEVVLPTGERKKRKNWRKYAAAAAIIPLAFYSFWIPLTSDVLQSRVLFKEDFNPFKKSPVTSYIARDIYATLSPFEENKELQQLKENLPENVTVFHYPLTEDVFVPVRRESKAVPSVAAAPMEKAVEHQLVAANYHLIAGCFQQLENAHNLIEKLQAEGANAFILDQKDGLHRVSAAQINDKSALEASRNKLAEQGFKTWVLRN
jgi:cell division septation protein DedD